jgi:hypothetical protein
VATAQSINHIIFMMQENWSWTTTMRHARVLAANGIPDQLDGLPQFNNPSQLAATSPGW